jgi:hypothetical protein
MSRLEDGTVGFIHGDLPVAHKLLAIDVRQAFPMISLGKGPILIHPDWSQEEIQKADHLSVPPDLRLHITSHTTHIMFDVSPIWSMLNTLSLVPVTHFFTFVGVPFAHTKPLVRPGGRKVWNEAVLIFPIADKEFSANTRFGIEFFIHSTGSFHDHVVALPFTISSMNMRLASDRTGPVFGPYWFGAIQRRGSPPRQDIMFSIRMCYAAPVDNRPVTFTYTPLAEFARRPRRRGP